MLVGCLVGCSESIDPSRPAILGGETSQTEPDTDTNPPRTTAMWNVIAEPGFYRAVDVGVLSIGFFDDDELFEVRVNTDMDGIAAFGITMPYTLDGIERIHPLCFTDALVGPAADASTSNIMVFSGVVTERDFLEAGTAVVTAKVDGIGSITFDDYLVELGFVLPDASTEMYHLNGVTLSNAANEE